MAKIKGIIVNVLPRNEPYADTNDRIYLGITGTGGGCEFPLDATNFIEFPRGGRAKLRFGDVWDTSAAAGARAAYEADGKNDPEGRCVDLDQVQSVYLRKSTGNPTGTADDEWKMDEIEVTLYAASPQKRTFYKKEDIWLGNEFGLQVWLKERTPFIYACQNSSEDLFVIDGGNDELEVVETVKVGSRPSFVAVTPDKSRVYVGNSGSQNVSIIKAAPPHTVTATVPLGAEPFSITIHPNGRNLYVTCGPSNSGSIKVLDIASATPAVIATVPVTGIVYSCWGKGNMAINSAGTRLFVGAGPEETKCISVYDISSVTPTLLTTICSGSDTPEYVGMNPGGKYLYVSYYHGGVYVFDTTTNPPSEKANLGWGELNGITLNDDGSRLMLGAPDGNNYVVFNTSVLPPVTYTAFTMMGEDFNDPELLPPGSMVFSPDGTRVYMESGGKMVAFDMTVKPPAIVAEVSLGGEISHVTV